MSGETLESATDPSITYISMAPMIVQHSNANRTTYIYVCSAEQILASYLGLEEKVGVFGVFSNMTFGNYLHINRSYREP